MSKPAPIYRRNLDDAPRQVAVMARGIEVGHHIPLHMHRRGQVLHATSGIMRVETAQAAWILPPARALWLPPEWPHSVTMRSHVEMRTVYIAPAACAGLPQQPVLVEISGLLRELILALLEEPADYDEMGRGGIVARLMLTELARLRFASEDPVDPDQVRLEGPIKELGLYTVKVHLAQDVEAELKVWVVPAVEDEREPTTQPAQ